MKNGLAYLRLLSFKKRQRSIQLLWYLSFTFRHWAKQRNYEKSLSSLQLNAFKLATTCSPLVTITVNCDKLTNSVAIYIHTNSH